MDKSVKEQCYNQLVLDKALYDDHYEFTEALQMIVMQLSKNGYDMIIRTEEERFFIIEYNTRSREVGDPVPTWSCVWDDGYTSEEHTLAEQLDISLRTAADLIRDYCEHEYDSVYLDNGWEDEEDDEMNGLRYDDDVKTEDQTMVIDIKYHDKEITKISKISTGDWIDLRTAEDTHLKGGERKIISLGVSMKLPDGYEAHIVPRSSTCKTFKIIQTNSMGVIDNSYCGNNDIWGIPVMALEDTHIPKDTRICQFRIVPKMPNIEFNEVEHLDGDDRGGFGSTGVA